MNAVGSRIADNSDNMGRLPAGKLNRAANSALAAKKLSFELAIDDGDRLAGSRIAIGKLSSLQDSHSRCRKVCGPNVISLHYKRLSLCSGDRGFKVGTAIIHQSASSNGAGNDSGNTIHSPGQLLIESCLLGVCDIACGRWIERDTEGMPRIDAYIKRFIIPESMEKQSRDCQRESCQSKLADH